MLKRYYQFVILLSVCTLYVFSKPHKTDDGPNFNLKEAFLSNPNMEKEFNKQPQKENLPPLIPP